MTFESHPNSMHSTPRVSPRLSTALGGVIHLTWAQQVVRRNVVWSVLLLAAIGGVGLMLSQYGDPQRFINWLNQIFLMLSVPLVSFDAGARAIREDLKPGAVDYIITRPVPRWGYAMFKYIAQWCVIMPLALGGLGMMLLLAQALEVQLLPMAVYVGVTMAGVSAFLALGFLMGSLTSRYVLLGLFYAGLIEAAVGNIPTQLNNLSILRHLRIALSGHIRESGPIVQEIGLVFLIAVGLLATAMLIFSRKEFIGKRADEG
jgi:ABC-2 type transport system permease protein